MLSKGFANIFTVKNGDYAIEVVILKLKAADYSTSYFSGSDLLLTPILPLVEI